jgi:hypothetical protein
MKRFAGLAVAASLAALAVAPAAQADTTSSDCTSVFLPIPLCLISHSADEQKTCLRLPIPLCKQD